MPRSCVSGDQTGLVDVPAIDLLAGLGFSLRGKVVYGFYGILFHFFLILSLRRSSTTGTAVSSSTAAAAR